ncbi:amino acid ABC transporter permease [Nocardioides sp. R-C-SC26]|uniref:amino acid ABC transporter permease n=1 Tax=Nocardioides sp. R-C-SC26 TaxID=2870414 RepID=UPI001E2CB71E|nr:amino acid ABC transporter permease [Nocardioides sp. R-C-SC26]
MTVRNGSRTVALDGPGGEFGDGAAGRVPDVVPVRPLRRPGRWVATVVVAVLAAAGIYSVATNERFEWDVAWEYFRSEQLIDGALMTLRLTVFAMAIGIALGIVVAVMRQSGVWLVERVADFYVWFFRGTPVLVQIFFWYNIASLYPDLNLGIPGMDPWLSVDANEAITPLMAAMLALGLNEGAYMSEIVRAGLLSVDEGQMEAAQSLGMSRLRALRRVVLPQAMRVIIPPTGNETIGMLKATALVSVVAVADLLYSTQVIIAMTFQTIPLLIAASAWYIVMTTVLSIGQGWLERHFSRGALAHPPDPFWVRWRTTMTRFHAPRPVQRTAATEPDQVEGGPR